MGDCIAIIPARGGSKGIPDKNIIPLAGKPLIAWSIEHALKSELIDSVWVTSDSQKILDVAKTYGARTIRRPSEISGDKATSEEAWIHALNEITEVAEIDLLVCMQCTSPVRGAKDLDQAIEMYRSQGFDSLLSVTKIEDHFEWVDTDTGAVPVNYDHRNRKRRQDIDVKYLENGSFYILKPEVLQKIEIV